MERSPISTVPLKIGAFLRWLPRALLVPAVAARAPDDQAARRILLLNGLGAGCIIMALAYCAFYCRLGAWVPMTALGVAALCGVFALVLLRRTGRTRVSAELILVAAFVTITGLEYFRGGPIGLNLFWFFFIPLISIGFSGLRSGLLWTVVCMITQAIYFGLARSGHVFPNVLSEEQVATTTVFTFFASFLFIAGMAWLFEKTRVDTVDRLLEALEKQTRSEQQFSELFNNTPIAVELYDGTGALILANPASRALWSSVDRRAHGPKSLDGLDLGRVTREKLAQDGRAEFELEPARAGAPETIRYLEGIATRFEDGMTLVHLKDTTERVRAEHEKARLWEELHHAQKLEAIGTLASGIAHDFNNLLLVLQTGVEMMGKQQDLPPDLSALLSDMSDSVTDGAELTTKLLEFAQRRPREILPADLGALVADHNRIFSRTWRTISVDATLPEALPNVELDRSQIKQVLMNLYINAAQAMPAGGTIAVTATAFTADADVAATRDVLPGAYVQLTIRDDGVGMDDATKARVFEPFFSTKTREHGTGLGLASAYGIVRNHLGAIWVESTPDQGSTFHVLLPATNRPVHTAEADAPVAPVRFGGTVLIIDDEPRVARAIASMAEEIGFVSLVATSGREGLATYHAHRGAIVAVLLDLVMPEMSGHEVLRALRAIDEEAVVIISTGHAFDGTLPTAPFQGCLRKPYSSNVLAAELTRVIGQ